MKKTVQFLAILSLFFLSPSFAQKMGTPPPDTLRKDAINLFVNCSTCDLAYLKKQIAFVNYVRDTKEAQVHLLITSDETGSGGAEYSLFFIGQNDFKGVNDTIKESFESGSTSDERRTRLADKIKIGLMRYVSKTPLIKYISISYDHEGSENSVVTDKWNSWVFGVNASGNVNAQSMSSSLYLSSSLSANRTTEFSKLKFDLGSGFNEQRFDMGDEVVVGVNRSYYLSHLYAKSINQHWSIGEYVNMNSSTYSNKEFAIGVKPALEFNVFPYSEYNRRKLCFNYSIGGAFNKYIDTTVFYKTNEFYGSHNLSVYYQTIQKWGSAYVSIDGSAFLSDFNKNSFNVYTSIDWRVFKGFSLNWSMSYSIVRNQIGIAKGAASRDEVLLSLRQLKTDYTLWTYFGIGYTFGSIYNNVVNPRF